MYTSKIPYSVIETHSVPAKRLEVYGSGETTLDPLLRKRDLPILKAVSGYLEDNDFGYQLVGGSVLRNALEGRPRKYGDIDMIGIGFDEDVKGFCDSLRHKEVLDLGSKISVESNFRGEADGFYRFIFTPIKQGLFFKKAPIDLAVTGADNFKRYVKTLGI